MIDDTPGCTPRTCTVLVVDDNKDIRFLVGRWLNRTGYDVLTAPNAQEALTVCSECDVDVALCDVRMPDHDGIWLAGRIHDVSPQTQIVFATAVEELPAAQTLRPGVVGYIVKPFEASTIIDVVDRACLEAIRIRPGLVGTRGIARGLAQDGALDGPVLIGRSAAGLLPPPPRRTADGH